MEMEEEEETQQQQQQQDDDEEKYLVGFVEVNVVGLQYYDGTVSNREMVRLIREPHNVYDRNAIRVENMRGEQVGHVERHKACYLAPLVDEGWVAIEGIVPWGSKNVYRMPCQVYIFTKLPLMAFLLDELRRTGLHVVTPEDSRFEEASAMASGERKLDPQEEKRSLDAIFDSLVFNRGKTYAMDPCPLITTPLYSHQREGLAWLVKRENSSDLPPFWQAQSSRGSSELTFINTLTNFMTKLQPEPFRGGILADEMGLGKTLALLALIATNRPGVVLPPIEETQARVTDEVGISRKTSKRQKVETKSRQRVPTAAKQHCPDGGKPAACSTEPHDSTATLIVCPLSVMSNWIAQLEEHTIPASLKVHMYHGPDRIRDTQTLRSFDIVLTTYNILAIEGDSQQSPLQRVQWLRIILDEAHLIKSPSALQTRAAVSLKAHRRWAVTGTPIQNSAKDLYSLVMFLKLQPLDDRSFWNRTLQRPLLSGDASGFARLQALMMTIALRRSKDMRIDGKRLVDLPQKTVSIYNVELSPEDRELYDKVEWEGKQLVRQYVASGTVLQNYATVLQIILRLRQICDHSALCPLQDQLLAAAPISGGE
eukprot:c28730_g1_i2 orf=268-2055(+)